MGLIETLKENINNAGHLVSLDREEGNVAAGIISVNDYENTVTYLHGHGLAAIKKAKEENIPVESVIDNPNNYFTRSITDFSDFIKPLGNVSRWRY